ncbi:MAG: hypothetical protein NTW78_11680 [Campylobacterales bacterium]|nr:hypothetical protein [Campylobacterales bacterium]
MTGAVLGVPTTTVKVATFDKSVPLSLTVVSKVLVPAVLELY